MPLTLEGEAANIGALLANPAVSSLARLAKSAMPLDTGEMVLADITEADFPGYAPVPISAAEEIFINEQNYAEVITNTPQWIAGAIVTPQSITAVYLTISISGGPQKLWNVEVLPRPFLFELPDQLFEREIRILSAQLAT